LPKPPAAGGRRQAKAYEGAFEAVAAVIIAALIGYWLDTKLESAPWALVAGTAIGFAAMVLRLFRLGRELEAAALADERADRERDERTANDDEQGGER